jgi:winged helix DNA-binding protein
VLPLPDVLDQIAGLQTQYAPSGYVGLWSRMARFKRSMLTEALETRQAIQATLMRATIHTVSAGDFWPIAAGVRQSRREWFERVGRRNMASLDMPAAADAVRQELTDGPLKLAELTSRLAARGLPDIPIGWVGMWVDLVRVPPSGTWEQRRADTYGLADQWLPPARDHTEDQGLRLLVERYLRGFGPARPTDIASWAGVPMNALKAPIEQLELRRFRDEAGKQLIDVPDAPLPPENTPAPVRFLPTWDATLLVHARRTQILPEPYRPLVFNTKTPHSVPTFLVDGQVCGTWRYDAKQKRVVTNQFGALSPAEGREVADEAERLAAFHGP